MSRTRVKCHAFVDFDGTIVPCDVTDFLLERFADPSWQEVEKDWQAGRIGSRAWADALLWRTVSGLRSVSIDARFSGTVSAPRVDISSNVGEALAASLQRDVGIEARVTEAETRLAAVKEELEAKVRELTQQLPLPRNLPRIPRP